MVVHFKNTKSASEKDSCYKTNIVILLLGPTGVGKTCVSIVLAKALSTEIISADSMQIYRGMDIGTAKPSQKELKEVKHHLIGILSPEESFSAGQFKNMATTIIDSLHSKGKIPIVVGGTGLYIKTLTKGLFEGPSADWTLREKLIEEEKHYGKGHLYSYLKKIDHASAIKINPNDTRRIIRAIEVSIKGSKSISELQRLGTVPQVYKFIKIGLLRDRKELYKLIEQRVDKMINEGLIDEVKRALKMIEDRKQTNSRPVCRSTTHRVGRLQTSDFGLKNSSLPGLAPCPTDGRRARSGAGITHHSSLPSMQALGYKEIQLYINGDTNLEEAVRLFKKRTKMYAKRQFTWFKKEPEINWVDITGIMNPDEIFAKVINDVDPVRKLIIS